VITAIYAFCSAVRLFFYVPQMLAVVRERSAAHAISLISWIFWALSHAATALYGHVVTHDALLGVMMWGNARLYGHRRAAALKRHRYGWVRKPISPSADSDRL